MDFWDADPYDPATLDIRVTEPSLATERGFACLEPP